ncbi:hypothetical protein [Marinoscillum luteum]|uniref:RiboL-PSP-HEPN domain-containing protein n=1 Tax=Marinoscillum luteum TaxID=861051 RepID=A0ABW7N2V0_9BACT
MASELDEYSLNRDKVFKELGKFNVHFEQITHSLKDCIATILISNGLKDETYIDCITSKLTSEPILRIFQSTSLHFLSNKEEKEKINQISNVFVDLIQVRNMLIHASWIIGLTNNDPEPNEPYILGIKARVSKKGVSLYNLGFKIKELRELNIKVEALNQFAFQLSQNISQGDRMDNLEFNINFKSELKKMTSQPGT